jgi:hypothetical protein
MAIKYPQKEARLAAGRSLVQVAAEADCAINTVRQYEVAPDTVTASKRLALDAVYGQFPAVVAA